MLSFALGCPQISGSLRFVICPVLHPAKYAKKVTLLVRGPSLSASMAEYLISQLEATRNVAIRYSTMTAGARDQDGFLAAVKVAAGTSDATPSAEIEADGLFVLIRSVPRISWLPDSMECDPAGFLRTGAGRHVSKTASAGYARSPLALKTSMPGVFAISAVRSGSIKFAWTVYPPMTRSSSGLHSGRVPAWRWQALPPPLK